METEKLKGQTAVAHDDASPVVSDAGPLSVDSVHRPSRPSHTRNVFHFCEGIMAGGGMSLSSVPLFFNLFFVL